MKPAIHPAYNNSITATCACGNSLTIGSTASEISVEVCSSCHPFYTGKQKFVDVAGRVDKFRHRQQESVKLQATTKKSKAKKGSVKKSGGKVTKLG